MSLLKFSSDVEAHVVEAEVAEENRHSKSASRVIARDHLPKVRPEPGLENKLFKDVLGQEILLTMQAVQLNLLGQVFRPIFAGRVVKVTDGFITLDPVILKIHSAPFHRFPTPLSFPLDAIANFVPFDMNTQFPIP